LSFVISIAKIIQQVSTSLFASNLRAIFSAYFASLRFYSNVDRERAQFYSWKDLKVVGGKVLERFKGGRRQGERRNRPLFT
jgi:hypothetical protein